MNSTSSKSSSPESASALPDCHVCGQPLTGETAACNNCDRPFHLRTRDAGEGRDCGAVWINEQYLSLEFSCDVCLGKPTDAAGAEPPVGHGH